MKLRRISVFIGAATTALSIAAFPSSAHALTYSWDINLSGKNYQATGQIYTNTKTPNYALQNSDITGFLINLTDGTTTDTLTNLNTTNNSTAGLRIDNTGSSLYLPQVGTYTSVDIKKANGSRLYFGYPFTTGSVPNLLIALGASSTSGSITSNLATSSTFATASVPFEIPGGATIPTVGGLFALGMMRRLRKSIASNTPVSNLTSGTVSAG